jgi:hypothetical protein
MSYQLSALSSQLSAINGELTFLELSCWKEINPQAVRLWLKADSY